MKYKLVTLTLILNLSSCFLYTKKEDAKPIKANALVEQKMYDEAIKLYEDHIVERLSDESRPKSENPYFYLLLIGDIFLKKDDPDTALQYYQEALRRNISKQKYIFRIIEVSKYFSDNDEYEKALTLLNNNIELDNLGIGYELDRVHRKFIASEDEKRKSK